MENKLFKNEQESINYFVKRLNKAGYQNINATQSSDKFCYYDIEAERNGKKFRFELKRRNFGVDQYDDHLMECSKLVKFESAIKSGEIDAAYLISLCFDGIKISHVLNWAYKDIVKAPQTTDFNRNNYVDKSFVHYTKYHVERY